MIPVIDIAILLARRGAVVTIFTTPLNYARFETQSEFLAIQVIQLKVGLLPSHSLFPNFYTTLQPATTMLQKQIDAQTSKILEKIDLNSGYFILPDMPDTIKVNKLQLPLISGDILVYVSLNITPSQHIELGLGLEASTKHFIWVIRGGKNLEQLEEWIKEDGFEERIKSRGLLTRGWPPKILILVRVSIVTWPLFADHFMNEKLVSQVLNIAVRVGVEVPLFLGQQNKIGVLVKRDVKEAIEKLMGEGQEILERRERARELGVMAKRAVEQSASSDLNFDIFDSRYYATNKRPIE
ncbi:hypothetical protein FNV43_RR06381 [Rhamnella rubrinervis]|uniref:Uncharacterized protein n=1 Tax=Rhamnella rubrinervis TaxID=2594499 RepID=A0A8K0HCY0_9ROSA|nr:hypothetical protein FNV43_RR06381 [Rhamnella rubrinervis]